MFQAEELSITYGGTTLFKDASFGLQKGERCGLVGRNGSGKTTLFRLITGQQLPDSGKIFFPKNYRLGFLDQHIRFTHPTIIEEAASGLREEDFGNYYKVEKILFGLGFKEEDLEKSPHQLSGGYQLRLQLTKVLSAEPDCLLLDEPTNYLDIISIRWLSRFLQQWKGEFIIVSHDREFMDKLTTHTLGIHRQKICKIKGSTVDFFEQILLNEKVHEQTRITMEKKRQHAQSFVERFGAKASKAAQAQSKQKMLDRIPVLEQLKELYNLDFIFNEAPFAGKKMLETENISFSYSPIEEENHEYLIDQLSLIIEKGERIAIIGKNGRGKSTVLRLLAGDLSPQEGEVKSSDLMRIGYFGQTNIQRLDPQKTIEEEVGNSNPVLNLTQVKKICGLMMFSGDQPKKKISVLSGGEKSRVLLAKILAKPCNLLLLDEPTHHLDMESIEALIDALEDFSGAVVIVTHSELILKRLPLDQLILCRKNKQEVFKGSYEEFLDTIGWDQEEEGAPLKKKKTDGKDSKKKRADLINERSRILKPLQSEIERIEAALLKLENEQKIDEQKLINIVSSGKNKEVEELSKNIGKRQKEIDDLYHQLEKNLLVYEQQNKEFETKLNACLAEFD